MADKYSYDRSFRLKILSLMLDNFWMTRHGETLIRPEYFDQDDEENVARAIIEYRERYRISPSDPDDLMVMAGGNGTADLIFDIFEMRDESDTHLASDISIQFAKEQAAKLAVLEGIDDINRGDLAKVLERMKAAIAVGDNLFNSGIDPVRDADKWLYNYWQNKIHTGWWHVDNLLEGGLAGGELGVVLGPTNRGKTMALVNIGYGAAALGSGKNIVHFTHEARVEQVARRYAARMTFRFARQDEDLENYEDELIEVARRYIPGKIRIIGGTRMTTVELENHLNRLRGEGFNFDLIIDDYPDLLQPPHRYNERRFELSAIFSWCRELADQFGVPFWGATQGNRESLSKEIVTAQDVAEDIGKANIADVIVAICQTREEEAADRCRLYMAKVRDAAKKLLFAAKYYGRSQAIITTGVVQLKKEEKDA